MGLDFARSGSRLVAMGYSSNEAKVFRTFHDQQLGVDCDFVASASGAEQLCVPTATAMVAYTDADCTEPTAWLIWNEFEEGDIISAAAPASPLSTCAGDTPLYRATYRVGEKLSDESLPTADGPPYQLQAGKCQHAYPPAKLTPATYRLTPIADSELVAAKQVSVKVTDSLRLTRLLAEDGAELNLGATDTARAPCQFQRDGECVPEPVAVSAAPATSSQFWEALNADCSDAAFEGPWTPECGESKFGVSDDGVSKPRIFAMVPTNGAFAWTMDTPPTNPVTYSCMPAPSQLTNLLAPGRELTGTLPSVGQTRTGTGPLHVDFYGNSGNRLLPMQVDSQIARGAVPMATFVNEDGKPCQIMKADDDTEHCALADGSITIYDLKTYPEVVWGPL